MALGTRRAPLSPGRLARCASRPESHGRDGAPAAGVLCNSWPSAAAVLSGGTSRPRATRLGPVGRVHGDQFVRALRPVAQERAGVARVDDLLDAEPLGG